MIKKVLFNLFILITFIFLTSNISYALGFKLNCEFNNLSNTNQTYPSGLKDFFSNTQKHKFIGRDVNIIGSNVFGELKQNDRKGIKWSYNHEKTKIKYIAFLKNNKANIEIVAPSFKIDEWGTCFFESAKVTLENKNLQTKIVSTENKNTDKITSKIREKYLTFNSKVTKNWCYGADKDEGYMDGSHPLPGAKSFNNPCPGKYLKKFLLNK